MPTLTGFLEQAAGLHSQEIDAANDRRITVSTIHRSKGVEAQAVALLGCEEELLPSWRSISSPDPERLAEERRLFYVAATRAKDRLLITHVAERGRRPTGGPSRFLTEAGLLQTPTLTRCLSPHTTAAPRDHGAAPAGLTTNSQRRLMSNHSHIQANPPARTHAEAAALFRRPFAPGAIGFRAMTKVPYNGQPYAGAQVAAYLGAQSVIQRLNAVRPRPLAPAIPIDPGRVRPRGHAPRLSRLPADRDPPGRGGRPRRRGRL